MVRLDDGRVQLGGSSAARHADDGRPSGRHCQAQSEEGTTALVQPDVDAEPVGQRESQWRRARAGADDGIGDTEAYPLIDQGGAEGGLYAHPSCHSMSRCAVLARRWCSCTASPRRVGCGDLSGTCWRHRAPWWRSICPVTPSPDRYGPTFRRQRDLVAEAVRSKIGDEPCALLGYSLGGRVALHAALAADLPLSHVVFIGVTAGIEDAAGRASRRQSDEKLADDLEASGDVEGFIDAWLRGRCSSGWNREAPHRGPSGSATPRPAWLRACACAERAARNRCGITSEPCPPPSWLWPGRTTTASLRTLCEWPAWCRAASHLSSPVGAMPYTWLNPNRPAGSSVTGSTRPGEPRLRGCRPPQSSNPIARRAPAIIWSRAVVPSIGKRARPSSSPSARRAGAMATGIASRAKSDHGR